MHIVHRLGFYLRYLRRIDTTLNLYKSKFVCARVQLRISPFVALEVM
jgi:hypothetical protein